MEVFFFSEEKEKSKEKWLWRSINTCFFATSASSFSPSSLILTHNGTTLLVSTLSFFQRKRKSQRKVAAVAQMPVFSPLFQLLFSFLPLYLHTSAQPFSSASLLPGWCSDQLRGGWGFHPLESVRKRVFDPLHFFRGRVEPKDR